MKALLAATIITAMAIIPIVSAAVAEAQYPYYPCKTCHQAINVTGFVREEPFHNIDLKRGAHRGLYCSSCHVAPLMMELVGGAEIKVIGVHNTEELKETNRVCAVCHPREYRDYIMLVHGNKTFTCEGGNVSLVLGYKGVVYHFHDCPEYRNLKTIPAKACVECHDPHDPTLPPASILPEPSQRPQPPEQSSIAWSTFAVLVGSILLVGFVFTTRQARG